MVGPTTTVGRQAASASAKPATDLDAVARVLEDQELLEVAAGMTARLQEEVAVEQRSGIGEEGLDRRVAEGRIGHS